MPNETIHPGQLNRRVELFKYEMQNTATSERTRVETSLGEKWAKRIDVSGTEEAEGKLIALSVCKFILRFELDILKNGTAYFIKDIDGKFQVNSVSLAGVGRNRFIELKCSSRG